MFCMMAENKKSQSCKGEGDSATLSQDTSSVAAHEGGNSCTMSPKFRGIAAFLTPESRTSAPLTVEEAVHLVHHQPVTVLGRRPGSGKRQRAAAAMTTMTEPWFHCIALPSACYTACMMVERVPYPYPGGCGGAEPPQEKVWPLAANK